MTSQLSEDLAALDELFSDSSRWVKHEYAKVKKTRRISVIWQSDEATCWCLLGGVQRVINSDFDKKRGRALRDAFCAILGKRQSFLEVASYNDAPERRFRHIKALIAKARAAAEGV